MKFTILIGTLALAATTFTTIAHASAAFGNLDRGFFNTSRDVRSNHNRNLPKMKSKFFDFKFEMKHSRSKGKKNKDSGTNTIANPSTNGSGDVNNKPTPPQTPSVGGNGGHGNSGGNNTNPPQHNSNDIKGYDPFTGGLYGPGT